MKPLLLEEIRKAVRGRWRTASTTVTITSVTTDSRKAGPGALFIALRGDRFDGHDFLADAARAGCPAAVVCRDAELPGEVSQAFEAGLIGVKDTTASLADLAAYHRANTAASVIAVTGSNGKTTVKRMIHTILSQRLRGSASPKSFNNQIGVPLTLLGVEPGDDYVVCELGTNHPGEIAALARIARPDVAVITSVSEAHLEGLGSLDLVAAEKASILGFLNGDGLGVAWADSRELERSLRAYHARVIRFGVSDHAEVRLTHYEPHGWGSRLEINSRVCVELPLPGRHNALNALAAIAVAQRFGVDPAEAAAALKHVEPAEMRMQRIEAGGVTIINDAYNANPASMVAAAEVLTGCDAERKVMIVGDMGELGELGETLHRRVGRRIAEQGIDLLIGVGSLGRYIASTAREAGVKVETFDSLATACKGVTLLLREGDCVLIKASRAVGMETLVAPICAAFERKGTSRS